MQARLPDRYRVIEEVGQGGMAVVYRAQDQTLRREVAVKVLHPHLLTEPESKARLEREAQAVAKLQHDNIVQIYDYSGADSQASFIVTEFIDGQTLKQFLGKRSIPTPEVAAMIVIEVGAALAHAHGLGILHRDVKPENVMVRRDGVLKLMDFGVAQVLDLERMTVTGQLLGSPAYMAPEVIDGRPLDFRTDVFSLGIMLYQLATGELPFSGRNPHEVFKRIAEGRYHDPRSKNPLIGSEMSRIIGRALARRPEDRYPSVPAALEDLRAFVAGAGIVKVHEDLAAFFGASDAAAFDKAWRARLAAALCDSARRAREDRRIAQGLELLNRACALAPDDPTVRGELARLAGRQRRRKLAMAAAVVSAAAVVVILVAPSARERARRPRPTPAPPPPATAAATPKPVPTPPVATMPPVATPPSPVPPRKLAGRAEPVATPPARRPASAVPTEPVETVELLLAPSPITNVSVWLDGTYKGDFGPDNRTLLVPWDRTHKIEFRHRTLPSCCFPAIVQVGPEVGRPRDDRVSARLTFRPASLTVTTEPAKPGLPYAVEWPGIDRPIPGTVGSPVTIRFDENDEIRKSVTVTMEGASEVVEVRAGQAENHVIKLRVP